MSYIEITQPDPETGGTRVVVDGVDLSNEITSISAEFVGPEPARVTVEFGLYEDRRLCMKDATLIIGDATAEALKNAGWTPPSVGGGITVDAVVTPDAEGFRRRARSGYTGA